LLERFDYPDAWRRQGYIPREVWRPFGQMGFLLPEVPGEFGGAGVSLAYQLVVQDELAKAEIPANTGVHNGTPERANAVPAAALRGPSDAPAPA